VIDEGIPLTTIGKIVGWPPLTVVLMSTIYGHSRIDKMKKAVNKSSPQRDPRMGSSRSFTHPSMSTESRNYLGFFN
jgi:hypothetical protein